MYKAAKILKVQTDNGIEIRKPGDAVPEAEFWPNVGSWLNRGYIIPMNPEAALGPRWDRANLKPVREANEDDIARGSNSKFPKSGEPLPEVDGSKKAKLDGGMNEVERKVELLSLSRSDLDALAVEKKLNPKDFTNKNLLVDALLNG